MQRYLSIAPPPPPLSSHWWTGHAFPFFFLLFFAKWNHVWSLPLFQVLMHKSPSPLQTRRPYRAISPCEIPSSPPPFFFCLFVEKGKIMVRLFSSVFEKEGCAPMGKSPAIPHFFLFFPPPKEIGNIGKACAFSPPPPPPITTKEEIEEVPHLPFPFFFLPVLTLVIMTLMEARHWSPFFLFFSLFPPLGTWSQWFLSWPPLIFLPLVVARNFITRMFLSPSLFLLSRFIIMVSSSRVPPRAGSTLVFLPLPFFALLVKYWKEHIPVMKVLFFPFLLFLPMRVPILFLLTIVMGHLFVEKTPAFSPSPNPFVPFDRFAQHEVFPLPFFPLCHIEKENMQWFRDFSVSACSLLFSLSASDGNMGGSWPSPPLFPPIERRDRPWDRICLDFPCLFSFPMSKSFPVHRRYPPFFFPPLITNHDSSPVTVLSLSDEAFSLPSLIWQGINGYLPPSFLQLS